MIFVCGNFRRGKLEKQMWDNTISYCYCKTSATDNVSGGSGAMGVLGPDQPREGFNVLKA